MAYKISDELETLGCEFLAKPVSNQVFPILNNNLIEKLSLNYGFNIERKIDEDTSAIRLVTSWATKEEAVNEFLYNFKKIYR